MWFVSTTLFFLYTVAFSHEFFHRSQRFKTVSDHFDDDDVGEPLFLTPYIESGNISGGRNMSYLRFPHQPFPSYSGYLTVDKTYNSNLFFWYFPCWYNSFSEFKVLLWLQGGPGMSSLFGLFNENGAIRVEGNRFKVRRDHWAFFSHVIYIDSPVGTGFSFTNDSRGYCTNQTQVGEHLYSALIQFFQLFPELQQAQFFITGESYAGKYIPALAYTIHKKNPTAKIPINLQGMGIGNGWCDPEHQLVYSKHLYQTGLIDWNVAKVFEEYEKKIVGFIQNQQWAEAVSMWEILTEDMILKVTGFDNFYNYLQSEEPDYDQYVSMIQMNSARIKIHVGNLTFNDGVEVYKHLREDIMKSVAPLISELLEHYRIVFYNGQLDIIVSYPLTVNFLKNLKFSGSEDYKTAEREIWRTLVDVGGYRKKAGNLEELLVRNAGHMVPADQPKISMELYSYITTGSFPNRV